MKHTIFLDRKTQYIVKMSVFPKLIYRFDTVFFFVDKFILKLIWKDEVPRIATRTLKKNKKVE